MSVDLASWDRMWINGVEVTGHVSFRNERTGTTVHVGPPPPMRATASLRISPRDARRWWDAVDRVIALWRPWRIGARRAKWRMKR